ncbi:hypothetical protein C8J55DRAFT_556731 [Lentinula edodes]|uniref:Carrier domain-containing protein n=1 Tax=Lentinula lateritia TaxID=40482 RepID=A0A9W9AUW8_9AGAR|nr:hypothetical protein C8J55DRAFT_556731 [Lentinula edodes]
MAHCSSLTDSEIEILAAIALAYSTTSFNYWELENIDLVLRVVDLTGEKLLSLTFSLSYTVEQLYKLLHSSWNHPSTEELTPAGIIFLGTSDFPPDLDLPNFPDVKFAVSLDNISGKIELHPTSESRFILPRFHSLLSLLHDATPLETVLYELTSVTEHEEKLLLQWGVATPEQQSSEHEYSAVIHHYIEKVARETPEAVALQFENHTFVRYGELDQQADNLARYLVHELGVHPGDLVLEFFDRSVEMIIAQLAILKAGAAYVPLDIVHPVQRSRTIQEITNAKVCLTTETLRESVCDRLPTANVVGVDTFLSSIPSKASWPPISHSSDGEDLCYVMFTSGTTGTPKGVMVQHSAVVASVINGPAYNQKLRQLGPNLRTLVLSNYAFDYSTWDVFLTLTSGGCLCIAPKDTMLVDLTGMVNSMNVTFLETTPTLLSLLELDECTSLEFVYSSGEALSPTIHRKFLARKLAQKGKGESELLFANGGAPTETTVMSVFGPINIGDDSEQPVYGRPFGGNRLYILDSHGRLCPPGTVGQLWIGGPQVTKGYLGRDDLTAKVYRPDPYAGSGRMYNSGDLCSWLSDGHLRHHGRSDTQVKIRGQRVEVNEVETTILKVLPVKAVCVIKHAYQSREELLAFVVSNVRLSALYVFQALMIFKQGIVLKNPQQMLSSHLPTYMVPSRFISISELPVTSNGKTDQKRLLRLADDLASQRQISEASSESSRRPMSSAQRILLKAWSTSLSLAPEDIHSSSDFFTIGGDSIAAIRVAAICRAEGYLLNVVDFQAYSRFSAQTELLENRPFVGNRPALQQYTPFKLLETGIRDVILSEITEHGYQYSDIEDAYPSISSVAGLVSLAVTDPMSYMAQYSFKNFHKFDPIRMNTAWKLVVSRHQSLRTTFVIASELESSIIQVILKAGQFNLPWNYKVFESDADMDKAAQDYILQSEGFRLGKVPTTVALFEGDNSSTLVIQLHHTQFDGWCLPIILEHLQEAYAATTVSEDWIKASPPFSNFIQWVSSQPPADAIDYWRKKLESVAVPKWPNNAPNILLKTPMKGTTNHSFISTFNDTEQLSTFCAEHEMTLSSLISAALAMVLGLYEDSDDVLFGVVTSGRTGDVPGIEDIVGYCVSTVPCRVHIPTDVSLEAIVKAVHDDLLGSTPYQFLGLNDIITTAFPIPHDILRVLLTIENLPGLFEENSEFLGQNLRGFAIDVSYPFAVTVFPSPDNRQLKFHFQWDSEFLSRADVDWFQSHMYAILHAIIDHPSSQLRKSDFLANGETENILSLSRSVPDPPASVRPFFHQLVDEMGHQYPDKIAIELDNHQGRLTFKEYVARANQVAHALQGKGVRPEYMVPVLFNQNTTNLDITIAFLAILKAGGAFVPLNSAWPEDRLQYCIHQTRGQILICETGLEGIATKLASLSELPLHVSRIEDLVRGQPSYTPATPTLQMDSLSCAMFTSGTNGEPKGVLIEHGNIISSISNAATLFPLNCAERMLHLSPWTFNQGLVNWFLSLTHGKTLILADAQSVVTDISEVVNRTKADYVTLTPTLAQKLQYDIPYPHLKTLVSEGDKLPRQVIERWRDRLDLIDAYGSTETTAHCVSANHSRGSRLHPGVIGRPVGASRVYILDENMSPVPVGAVGELFIGGTQVARGYFDLPNKTVEVFLRDPFSHANRIFRTGDRARWHSDGTIEYLRRMEDDYVNIRGLRVDIEEIETTLMFSASSNKITAVVQLVEVDSTSHLAVFFSEKLGHPNAHIRICEDLASYQGLVRELLQTCQRTLPTYAVPSFWLALDTIPLGNNNKVDQKRLRAFFQSQSPKKVREYTKSLLGALSDRGPETPVEQLLHDMWLPILLRSEPISVHDDFFTLGGDSIHCIRFLAALKRRGCEVTVNEFYKARTIAQLADIVYGRLPANANLSIQNVESPLTNGLVVQIRSASSKQDKTNSPIWFVHDGKGLIGPQYGELGSLDREVYGISNPATTKAELEAAYPSWESFVQSYEPLLPLRSVFIGGWSSGGNIALLLAAEHVRKSRPVKGVILLDSYTGDGFIPTKEHKTDYPDDPAKARAYTQMNHIEKLLVAYPEPESSELEGIPVLLIRAGSDPMGKVTRDHPNQTKENLEKNLWSKVKMEIKEVKEANHKSLMAEEEFRQRVAKIVRRWCGELERTG